MSIQLSRTLIAKSSHAASLFKALSDPARVLILTRLARADSEICVCEFVEQLDINQSTVSHHLKILKDADLITSERRGTWVYYSLAVDAHERLTSALTTVIPEGVLA